MLEGSSKTLTINMFSLVTGPCLRRAGCDGKARVVNVLVQQNHPQEEMPHNLGEGVSFGVLAALPSAGLQERGARTSWPRRKLKTEKGLQLIQAWRFRALGLGFHEEGLVFLRVPSIYLIGERGARHWSML